MINISLAGPKDAREAPCLALFAFEDGTVLGAEPASLKKDIFARAKAEGFKSSLGEPLLLPLSAQRRVLLVGLGPKAGFSQDRARRAAGAAYQFAKGRLDSLILDPGPYLKEAGQGLLLSSYLFSEYKKADSPRLGAVSLAASGNGSRPKAEKALERAKLAAEAVSLARDLVNRGPSDKSPRSLAQVAKTLENAEVSVKVFSRAEIAKMGMGALLGVSRGSSADPAFVHLIYKGRGGRKRVGIAGKGITFDSGGISLKPPVSMESMKHDMAGAASVLGLFKVLPRLGVKDVVHGFCAFSYNMPGPDAMKPGDVVKAMNGKTIEVLNTDAEGRLVLADALSYAARQNLTALIDVATLTGAAVIALGSRVSALMSTNRLLARELRAAADRAGEPLWELPLVEEYRDGLKSPIADLRNISKVRGEAGTIVGGLFLSEFAGDLPWAHLDIAGPAWSESGSALGPAGATGAPARTLIELLSPS